MHARANARARTDEALFVILQSQRKSKTDKATAFGYQKTSTVAVQRCVWMDEWMIG